MFYTVCVNASKTDIEQETRWQKTPVANLVRNSASGIYYARTRVRGKLIWKTLKTDRLGVAKLRLGDFLNNENQRAESLQSVARGKMTFGDAVVTYRQRLQQLQHLKDGAKLYRENTVVALLKSWPELKAMDVRKITEHDCLNWSAGFAKKYSPNLFNNTVGTLRQILKLAIDAGARYGNPADKIKKLKVRQKILKLPEHNQFLPLVKLVRGAGSRHSKHCGDLIEFFAYSGARKSEAARVFGCDCDFTNGKITIKGDPETGTKNWEIRTIPMIPDMLRLLERIRSEKTEKEWLNNPVIGVQECQHSIDTACAKLEIPRFTHHDLRHLFATRCIESGVDIPTVSRWLGHKDGGALAMKTYGHLRDQHSINMAQKVTYSEAPQTNTTTEHLPNGKSTTTEPQKKTVAQAKAAYSYPWWASKNVTEVFWGQANEPVQIISSAKFLESAKQSMGRIVFEEELSEPATLLEEFAERAGASYIEKLKAKISRLKP
jgi:integrase